jgi:hypothetical protein
MRLAFTQKDCKPFIHRFDSDRRLQQNLLSNGQPNVSPAGGV